MDKLKKVINLIKLLFSGKLTKKILPFIIILILYRVFGVFGLILSLVATVIIDAVSSINIKQILRFVIPTFIVCITFVACVTPKSVVNTFYSISKMTFISKDSVTSQTLKRMIAKSEIPPLNKFAKSYFKNTEENKINAYYVYYDSLSSKLFNIKELTNNKDTSYIVETKALEK